MIAIGIKLFALFCAVLFIAVPGFSFRDHFSKRPIFTCAAAIFGLSITYISIYPFVEKFALGSSSESQSGSTEIGMFAEDIEGCRTSQVNLMSTTSKDIPVCRVGSKEYRGNRLFTVKLPYGHELDIEFPGFSPTNRPIMIVDDVTGKKRKYLTKDFIDVMYSTEEDGLLPNWRAIVVKPEVFDMFFEQSKLPLKEQDDFLRMEFTAVRK